MPAPDPNTLFPVPGYQGTAFLKPIVDHPQIVVGEYSYYDDPAGPEQFVPRCVKYLFDFVGDRLIIGRFVAIATGVRFVMNGANHAHDGFSTYPFDVMGFVPIGQDGPSGAPPKGDTVVGDDVWIGREAVIMPGVTIGPGAIIGTAAVVTRDVPPYAIAAGNPARIVRLRFDEGVIARLLAIRWWDWQPDKIARNAAAITGTDIDALEAAA